MPRYSTPKTWRDVALDGIVLVGDGCWTWANRPGPNGYCYAARGRRGDRQHKLAHRLVYEELVGDIPAGYEIDHTCQNKACVNPGHMMPLSPGDHRRVTAARTTCKGWE